MKTIQLRTRQQSEMSRYSTAAACDVNKLLRTAKLRRDYINQAIAAMERLMQLQASAGQ
jgi:hypothetical protein